MATLVLDGVRKSFGEREVVHGVSCAVDDGELVVVVGPSGCGKSTLLRMVAGLETVSAGTVAIDGRVVNRIEPKDRDIAMVFQNYALYPHMSVYDNMAYGLRMRRMSRHEIQRLQQELATTSLYVTHDQVEAMTLADRLIVMNAGNVDQIGRPLDLYERPATAFVAGFIGSPAMNLLAGRLDRHSVTIGDVVLPIDAPDGAPDRRVRGGLRPEHLDLAPDGPLALKVELLERLGADTILHGRLGDGVRMTARTAANFAPPLGDTARFAIRPEQIHLFDPETGRRL